jgi:hypothetical protein
VKRVHILYRRGATLIEAVLFIAVALGLIIGGLVFYEQARLSAMTRETVSLLSALGADVTRLYKSNRNTSDGQDANLWANRVLVASGAVPPNAMTDNPDEIVAPWDGRIEVLVILEEATGGRDFQTFAFYIWDVPPQICARLAYFDRDGNGALGFRALGTIIDPMNQGVDVSNGTASATTRVWFVTTDEELTIAEAGSECRPGAGQDSVFLGLVFAYR